MTIQQIIEQLPYNYIMCLERAIAALQGKQDQAAQADRDADILHEAVQNALQI